MRTTNYVALLLMIFGLFISSCEKDNNDDVRIYYPTEGLVSYFKFNNTLSDELGNTPAGENTNNAAFVDGVDGKAIQFNGVDQQVEFDRKTYKDGNNISVSLWFLKPSSEAGTKFVVSCSDFGVATNLTGVGYAISLPVTNSAIGTFVPGEWTHFAGTYDGTDIKSYINGVLAETINHQGDIADADRNLILGSLLGLHFWEGAIDEFFIYNRVLTPAEVSQLYNR